MADENSLIYLDYNATSPTAPEVINKMVKYLSVHWGNPTSPHVRSEKPKAAIRKSRQQLATLLSCKPEEIIFTSGGSESNALALFGSLKTLKQKRPLANHLIVSVIEHKATTYALQSLAPEYEITEISVDSVRFQFLLI
jgi:cysteine desulfurase